MYVFALAKNLIGFMKSLWFIITIVILLFLGWLVKDSILSHFLFRDMGFDASASNIFVTPSHLKMDHFRIKNPIQYRLRTAFSSKRVNIDYTLDELKEKPSYIDQIVFDEAHITIECNDQNCSENNWKKLVATKTSHDRNFIIDRVVFQNLTVEVLNHQDGQTPKKIKTIPYLVLTQVSSEEGFPVRTIIEKAFASAELNRYSQGFPGHTRRETRRAIRRGYYWN